MDIRGFALKTSLAIAGLLLPGSPSAWAQAEIGAYGGGAHFAGGTHAVVGGTVGVHASEVFQVSGEANYIPLGSSSFSAAGLGSSSSSAKLLNFGGGVAVGIPTSGGKVVPYVVAVAGVGHFTSGISGTGLLSGVAGSSASNSAYVGGGTGLRLMLGKSWGFRPEVRYQRYVQNGGGNLLLFTGGIFLQFGK